MALSSKLKNQRTQDEIAELIDHLQKLIDRTKVMYEQYFMGIQKMPPAQLHRDIERRIRELTQENIRNTGLRYKFSMLSQKFGSYNSYWKRTMRKIERGEYERHLAKVGRKALRSGEDVPDEMLVKMPKRIRDRILRDRKRVQEKLDRDQRKRRSGAQQPAAAESSPGKVRQQRKVVHEISEDDADLDLDAIFSSLADDDSPDVASVSQPAKPVAPAAPARRARPAPAARRSPAPPARRASPRPAASARRPARASAPPGMSTAQSRDLYDKYVKARKLVGDRRDVSYDKLMSKLSKQAPAIMKKHNARAVDFSVVIKGDKVILKAKPKK